MSKCTVCGKKSGFMMGMCNACIEQSKAELNSYEQDKLESLKKELAALKPEEIVRHFKKQTRPLAKYENELYANACSQLKVVNPERYTELLESNIQSPKQAEHETKPEYAGFVLLVGLVTLGIGLYNLFNPEASLPADSTSNLYAIKTSSIANLHKLFIGTTLSIVGAMFTLAGAKSKKLI